MTLLAYEIQNWMQSCPLPRHQVPVVDLSVSVGLSVGHRILVRFAANPFVPKCVRCPPPYSSSCQTSQLDCRSWGVVCMFQASSPSGHFPVEAEGQSWTDRMP